MADLSVQLADAAQIRAGLRVAPQRMKKELRRSHLTLARQGRGWARSAAVAGTSQQRRMATGIGSSATSTSAALSIRNIPSGRSGKGGAPGALGAYYGSKQYPQFPKWVGNKWPFMSRTKGPQPINRALAAHERDIDDLFLDGQLSAVARAFPGRH